MKKLTLPLQEGKQYELRNGTVITVKVVWDDEEEYPVQAVHDGHRESWTAGGKFHRYRDQDSRDIVADWVKQTWRPWTRAEALKKVGQIVLRWKNPTPLQADCGALLLSVDYDEVLTESGVRWQLSQLLELVVWSPVGDCENWKPCGELMNNQS